MKMKKTLAGVMAGAMAVSAMAVSVSAANTNPVSEDVQEEIVLTYDLRAYEAWSGETPSKTIVRELYTAVDGEAYGIGNTKALTFGASHWSFKKLETADIRVTKTNQETGKSVTDPFLYTRNKDTANESGYMYTKAMFEADSNELTITVPLTTDPSNEGKIDLNNYKLENLGYTNASSKYGFTALEITLTIENAGNWVDLDTHVDQITSLDKGLVDAYTGEVEKPDSVKAIKVIPGAWLGGEYVYPMMSALDDPANVIAWLQGRKAGGNYYTRPLAVLNDAIANDQNVIFEFRSAQQRVATDVLVEVYDVVDNNGNYKFTVEATDDGIAYANSQGYTKYNEKYFANVPTNVGTGVGVAKFVDRTTCLDHDVPGKTETQFIKEYRAIGAKVVNTPVAWSYPIADNGAWYNPYFSQHLYGESAKDHFQDFQTDDYSNYGSHSTLWGVNLFNGALVINQNITMQLNQTSVFQWDYDTLTFDWFTLTDEGKITRANQLLNTMLLYTPTDWFWDQLVVTVAAAEADNVEAGEGLDGEGDTLDEDPADLGDIEDVEPEPEPAPEPAPAPNPTTGNAPVALAVIPVALAAAAVVAKKRG